MISNPLNNFIFQNKKHLQWLLSIAILAFSLFIIGNIVIGSADLHLSVSAPQSVEIDQPLEIEVNFSSPEKIAGYELLFQFDKDAVEFAGIYAGYKDGMPVGRELIILDNVPQGAAFAVYTCQIEGCEPPAEDEAYSIKRVANEEIETIRLRLLPLKAGALQVGLESVRFVDKNGDPIEVEINHSTVEINVLDNGAKVSEVIENFATPWNIPNVPEQTRAASTLSTLQATDLDRNNDGVLSFIDVVETTLVWKTLRQAGDICTLIGANSQFDVNADGCLDIVDIQLMALHKGSQDPLNANQSRMATNGLTFTVDSTSDDADSVYGDGLCQTAAGECTLRAAISESNAQLGENSIHFNISGGGVHTIQLTEALPTINDMTGGVTIDGFTQPGSSENIADLANNSVILIEIRGLGLDQFSNFIITSPHNVLRGLSIYDSDQMIELYEDNAQYNQIVGNFIGTNAAGTFISPIRDWQTGCGVYISQGASRNTIGSPELDDRNVISGVPNRGVQIDHEGTDFNIIQNNIIGLNPTGTENLYNLVMGIDIQWGASSNIVGGTGFRERNVISGHSRYVGVDLSHSQSTSNNFVVGNFIGTDLTGTQSFEWTSNSYGMVIKDDAINNYIHDNIIAGNNSDGIEMKHSYNGRNYIFNNRIGVSVDGTVIGNGLWGIQLTGHDFIIGPGNIIAGNGLGGVSIDSRLGGGANEPADISDGNKIFQNSFYENAGLAIDIEPAGLNLNDSGDVDTGSNQLLNFPVIAFATTSQVSGTACIGCTVEVYLADSPSGNYGGGRLYLGETIADGSGNFLLPIGQDIAIGQAVTAIAIDSANNTSEFSLNVAITESGDPNQTRQNVALNKLTTQSSTSHSGVSSRAVDGNTSGIWSGNSVTHTDVTTQPWWQIDLGENSPIAEIVLWNRTNCCSDRLSDVHIFISDVPFTGDSVADSQNQAGATELFIAGAVGESATLDVDGSGRYVRVQLAGTNPLSLAEVQIFNIDEVQALPTPTFAPPTPIATGTPIPEIVPTQTPTPQPTTEANVIAVDSFSRSSSTGWGLAEKGGAYTHLWGASAADDFSADGSVGLLTLSSGGASRDANLNDVFVLDSVSEVTVSFDKLANANSFIRMKTRVVNNNTTYRTTYQISSNGIASGFVDRLVNGSWAKVGQTASLGIQLQPNTDYRLKVQTSGTNPTTISMKIWPTNGSEPTGWQHIVTDSTPELQVASGVGVRVNLAGAVSNTPIQYRFDDLTVKSLATPTTSTGRLETVSAAVDANWTTVALDQEYDSPVIACSIHYLNNSVPVVVRMQNVGSTSFDIRLQNPGDLDPVVADTVSCLVVEEGAWTLPDDRKIEAGLFNSTGTDHLGNWVGQRVNYSQSYSNPIVFGQVMSSNDARWSTFWNRGSSAVNPPSSSALYIGKQIAEDTDTGRLDETLGYIVFEAGSGTVDSTAYEAMLGADTVFDLTKSTTYTFGSSFGSTPTFALTSQAGMDGGNGGWSYQVGSDSLTTSGITVAIDEDQIVDTERAHTSEQVSYLVLESDLSMSWGEEGPPPPVDPETVDLEIYARDDFGRTQFSSWGFGNMGGAYVHLWGEFAHEAFSVNGSEGILVLNDNQNREANLSKIKQQDFDINFKFKTDQQASSNQELLISARSVSTSSLYRLKLQLYPGGGVGLSQIKAANGAWSTTSSQVVPGLTYTPGQYLNVRYQVVGINPTTLRAKVWADGTAEPADWHMSLTDSESVLQTTGSIGFKFFNRSGSNTAITYSMDDLFISNVTVLPVVSVNRTSDVVWKPIPSQGSTIYLPMTTNRSNGESINLGDSAQDQK